MERGYVGSALTNLLERDGYNFKVYDKLLYEDDYMKSREFQFGDIRDTDQVIKFCDDCGVVVLLAAIVGEPACNINTETTREINYEAIKNICEKLPKDKHVVFISTCSVYGVNDQIVTEESPTNPISAYSITKLNAETHVRERGGTILRLGTVFGLAGNSARLRSDLVVNTMTMNAFYNKKIVVNGGNQWRPLIAVKDVAEYILESCQNKYEGTFNLAYKNMTIEDIGKTVYSFFAQDCEIEIAEDPTDKRDYSVSAAKALELFFHESEHTIEKEIEGLKKVLTEGRIKNIKCSKYSNIAHLKKEWSL